MHPGDIGGETTESYAQFYWYVWGRLACTHVASVSAAATELVQVVHGRLIYGRAWLCADVTSQSLLATNAPLSSQAL